MTTADVLEKVRKLLKLAESAGTIGSIEESAAAAAMAQKLLFEHKLDMSDVPLGEQVVEEEVRDESIEYQTGSSKHSTWKVRLLTFVATHNFARVAYVEHGGRSARLVGRPDAVATTRYLYSFLVVAVERLCRTALDRERISDRGYARTWANSFRLGAIDTIANRLYEMRKSQTAGPEFSKAMVMVDKEKTALDQYIEARKKAWGLRSRSTRSAYDPSARGKGRRAAEGIDLGSAKISGSGAKRLGAWGGGS